MGTAFEVHVIVLCMQYFEILIWKLTPEARSEVVIESCGSIDAVMIWVLQ